MIARVVFDLGTEEISPITVIKKSKLTKLSMYLSMFPSFMEKLTIKTKLTTKANSTEENIVNPISAKVYIPK